MANASTMRKVASIGLFLVCLTLPIVVLALMGQPDSAGIWTLGTLETLIILLGVPARYTLPTIAAFGIATTLAVLADGSPLWSLCVMGLVAGVCGLSARYGWWGSASAIPIAIAFVITDPPHPLRESGTLQNAMLAGVVMALASAWAALFASKLRGRIHFPSANPASTKRTMAFAAVVAVLVGGTSWVVARYDLGHGGAWMMMTILLVMQPYGARTLQRSLHRALGTLLGFAIAFAIGFVIHPPWALFVLGLACMGIALSLLGGTNPYWKIVTWITPAVVLLEGYSGSVIETDRIRLTYTLVGAAVALTALVVLAGADKVRRRVTAPSH